MFAALEQGAGEAGTDLKSLGGRQRHHRLGQVCFQLVENRHAQPHCRLAHDALDNAAAGIALPANRFNALDHALGGCPIGTAHDVCLHRRQRNLLRVDRCFDVVDPLHPGEHLGALGPGQQLLGDGPCCHPANRFPGGGTAAATAGLDAVFGLVGGIGMGGAVGHLHFPVILGALVPVAHEHRDRGAQGQAIQQSAENLNPIVFFAGGGDFALAGLAPIELGLNRLQIEWESRRAAIYDHAHAPAVGLAEGGDAK